MQSRFFMMLLCWVSFPECVALKSWAIPGLSKSYPVTLSASTLKWYGWNNTHRSQNKWRSWAALHLWETLFLSSQLLLLGDYSRNKLLPNADLYIRVFMHSLHCCSWAKEIWEHKLRLFCFIVKGTHGIVFCNTNKDTAWGLGPLRKILNFFPFHFFFTGSSLPGVKSVASTD